MQREEPSLPDCEIEAIFIQFKKGEVKNAAADASAR